MACYCKRICSTMLGSSTSCDHFTFPKHSWFISVSLATNAACLKDVLLKILRQLLFALSARYLPNPWPVQRCIWSFGSWPHSWNFGCHWVGWLFVLPCHADGGEAPSLCESSTNVWVALSTDYCGPERAKFFLFSAGCVLAVLQDRGTAQKVFPS